MITIVGSEGYVGSVLVEELKAINIDYSRIDSLLFNDDCVVQPNEPKLTRRTDVRDLESLPCGRVLVYLAAVSNDPMGSFFEGPTYEINCESAKAIAIMAKSQGYKAFVYASSCSVYGAGHSVCNELAPLGPLTAYAKSKVRAEDYLRELVSPDFQITALRFATACGASSRFRSDLVLNDFVASSFYNGKIELLSDGTPLRPLIDVVDMADAIIWAAMEDESHSDDIKILNVGFDDANFSVMQIAQVVSDVLGSEIVVNNLNNGDTRSYAVDFGKYRRLSGRRKPKCDLIQSILNVKELLRNAGFESYNNMKLETVRLTRLKGLLQSGVIDETLRWSN